MFDVESIELENNRPVRVTLTVPVEFLAHVTKHFGGMRPMDFPHPSCGDFYGAMTATVFNTFWENGVVGAVDGEEG